MVGAALFLPHASWLTARLYKTKKALPSHSFFPAGIRGHHLQCSLKTSCLLMCVGNLWSHKVPVGLFGLNIF